MISKKSLFAAVLMTGVFTAIPAQAGPIVTAIASVLTSVGIGAETAAFIASTIVSATVSIGVSLISRALGSKPKAPEQQPVGIQGSLQTGGVVPRSFIFGQYATAGSEYYPPRTWGTVGKTPNAYMSRFIALSDLPCDGLESIIVDGKQCTLGSLDPSFGYAVPEYNKDGGDHLWVKFHDGSQTDADSWAVSQFGSDADYPYSSDMVGHGMAYAIVTARWEPTLFSSFPQYLFVINGAHFYDPRDDDTVGGSGDQRWDDPSTWTLTHNPAVVKYNILRGISCSGQWLFGMQNTAAGRLPLDNWFAAMNVCDTSVAYNGTDSVAQFRCAGEIVVSTAPADTLESLNKCDNGRLIEVGGIFKTRSGAAGSAVMSFTDANLIVTEQQLFEPFPGLENTANGVDAQYPEPTSNWAMTAAPSLYDSSLETADGSRRLVANIDYSFVPFGDQVQFLMKSARDEGRRFRKHTVVAPPSAFALEGLDIISWTSDANGYSNKLFTVVPLDKGNLDQGLILLECDPSDYDWDPATNYQSYTPVSVVSTPPASQAMVGWSAAGVSVVGTGGRAKPGIALSWGYDGIDDVDGVIFEIRLHGGTDILFSGETPHSVEQFKTGTLTYAAGLSGSTAYDVHGRFRPTSNRATDWSDWLEVTTPAEQIVSADLYDAIKRANLDAALKAFNDFIGASASNLLDHIQQVSQSVAEAGLGAAQDIQHLRRQLVSATGAARAEFDERITVVTSDVSAISTSLTELTATLGDGFSPTATISDALAAQTTANSATSDSLTELNATFGDIFASVKARFSAAAAPGDASARLAFSLSATDGGAAETAALYMDALTAGGSRILLTADKVFITNGTDQASLDNALEFVDGTLVLVSAVIGTATIDTVNIKNGAVVQRDILNVTTATTLAQSPSKTLLGSVAFSQINSWVPVFVHHLVGTITFPGAADPGLCTASVALSWSSDGSTDDTAAILNNPYLILDAGDYTIYVYGSADNNTQGGSCSLASYKLQVSSFKL